MGNFEKYITGLMRGAKRVVIGILIFAIVVILGAFAIGSAVTGEIKLYYWVPFIASVGFAAYYAFKY